MNIQNHQHYLNKLGIILIVFGMLLPSTMGTYTALAGDDYMLTISLEAGWNLIMDFTDTNQITSVSDIISKDIKLIYAYSNSENKYYRLHPNNEIDYKSHGESQWVYSQKSGEITYKIKDVPSLREGINLDKGWNFLGLVPGFEDEGLGLASAVNDCDILFSYYFKQQGWLDYFLSYVIEKNERVGAVPIGRGVLVKVSADCTLKEEALSVPSLPSYSVPSLPEPNKNVGSCCVVETGEFAFYGSITKEECETAGSKSNLNVEFVPSTSNSACDAYK